MIRTLTYMSIRLRLEEAVAAGRLVVFTPEFNSDPNERWLFLHATLVTELADLARDWGSRVGRLEADFEMFVKGEHISMSMVPFEHKAAYMGLLSPEEDGTWELRSRDPNPGLRIFGRFAWADHFVALNWEPRSVKFGEKRPLGDGRSLQYELAMLETASRWNAALPELNPLIGGSFRDYVSKNSSEV